MSVTLAKGYFEEYALSLEVENKNVIDAISGQTVGIKTEYSNDIIVKNTLVCIVMNEKG